MLPTERLFDKDPYMTEFSATVLFWKQVKGAFFAALDKTAFFPEGGGQFCDPTRRSSDLVLRPWHSL